MTFGDVREWLLPAVAERGEDFRQEIFSLSYRGLRIIAAAEVVIGIAAAVTHFLPWPAAVALVVLGAASVLTTRVAAAYPWSRLISVVSCGFGSAIASWSISRASSDDFALGSVTALVLGGSAVPLLPLQGLAIGIAAFAAGSGSTHRLFLIMLAVIETAVAATLYAQRRTDHHAYSGVLQAAQDFRALQARLLLAETSSTMVHLSAALAHELSSPIGAVSSAVSTLVLLSNRCRTDVPESEKNRLVALQSDLIHSLQIPLERLKLIVNRIQRVTNLDEAAVQSANLNELIQDAVESVQRKSKSSVRIQFHLQPLPAFSCRPQQLIAVLTNVLTNSMQALGENGQISISSKADGSRVEVRIQDDGRGISPDKLAHIFDPGFQVAGGRVSTGNWTLFTSRQFIKEHGGEMRIQSLEGRGTTVSLILPC